MRQILTQEEKEKKGTRNKVIIGLLLVAIMILGTAGFAFLSGTEEKKEKIEYNGVEFILNENGLWQFEIQNLEFFTQYNPKETENVSVFTFRMIYEYSRKPLFFIGEGSAKQEIAKNLANIVLRMQDACLHDYEEMCEEDAPIKNCSEDNIIIIKENEETKISQEDNCIFIEAPYIEQTRAADAFLFKVLGV